MTLIRSNKALTPGAPEPALPKPKPTTPKLDALAVGAAAATQADQGKRAQLMLAGIKVESKAPKAPAGELSEAERADLYKSDAPESPLKKTFEGLRETAQNAAAKFSEVVGALPLPVAFNRSPIASDAVVDKMKQLGALGNGEAQKFDATQFADLMPKSDFAAFSGSGATGKLPGEGALTLGDAAKIGVGKAAKIYRDHLGDKKDAVAADLDRSDLSQEERTKLVKEHNVLLDKEANASKYMALESRYRNPVASVNSDFNKVVDDKQRARQAELLLKQPIATLHAEAYGDKIPTRAEVIDAAAKKHKLDPNVLAGVLLQEQRDQSRKEDLADFAGGAGIAENTSIGLGQVTLKTAMKDDAAMLSDTIDEATRKSLSASDVAKVLSSDEHNIFAAAAYIRNVADLGASAHARGEDLGAYARRFPNFDAASLRGSGWNTDTIMAVASEYTSAPWDGKVVQPGYPEWVANAVDDTRKVRAFDRR